MIIGKKNTHRTKGVCIGRHLYTKKKFHERCYLKKQPSTKHICLLIDYRRNFQMLTK